MHTKLQSHFIKIAMYQGWLVYSRVIKIAIFGIYFVKPLYVI